jgi:hypothetical protein
MLKPKDALANPNPITNVPSPHTIPSRNATTMFLFDLRTSTEGGRELGFWGAAEKKTISKVPDF